jgi:hypothetical protein
MDFLPVSWEDNGLISDALRPESIKVYSGSYGIQVSSSKISAFISSIIGTMTSSPGV